ncbi:MAG: type II toxin-antitoxin system RelE/ParE family toxin [Candidatus Schekmanbacteria bacterium]|nr:type II toxin-antitoxin system RelE/ParE family toxin [Candidatus Schekmanbacteria bacterium]
MAGYEVRFTASAAKEFRDLPGDIKRRIAAAVDVLNLNPYPVGFCKLKGHENLFRIRIGVYRLVYEFNERNKQILVTRIRHRREAYR